MTVTTPATRVDRALFTSLFLAVFLAMLCMSVVTIALPVIQADLGLDVGGMQWIINSYTLCLAGLALVGGTVGDRYGRRKALLTGIALFVLGAALCALATDLTLLLVGRFVQGAGAALLVPGSMSLLSRNCPDPATRSRMMGLWGTVASLAIVIGPVVGGLLVGAWGWQGIFWVNVPMGALAFALAWRSVPESADPEHVALDPLGQLLGIAWLVALCWGLIDAGQRGWSGLSTILMVLAAVGLVVFVVVERRQERPMLPVRLFAGRRFSAATVASFLLGFGSYSMFNFLPVYLQQVQHHLPQEAGLRMLPLPLAIMAVSVLAGRLAAARGDRTPMLLGYSLIAAGLLGLCLLAPDSPYLAVGGLFAVIGVGTGLAMAPTSTAALTGAPPERSGMASAVVNASRQTGIVVGVAVLGAVLPLGGLMSGFHLASLIAGAATLIAVLAALLITPHP
ncbi:DHA2 family efflux MFS transporter permease subunit [Allokutzneria oryzae]|uniref:DHA2 family efflux MFS transporter permease subunit n=1 Tax=Allokutzneria oryzae TaxID=1378989 RepID=A0ABV5ZP40_9PSEU